MNVADLSRETVVWIHRAVVLASLAVFVLVARRPLLSLHLDAVRLEFAGCLAAVLWFLPLVRVYHLPLMLPGLSFLLNTRPGHIGSRWRCVIFFGILSVVVVLCLIGTWDLVWLIVHRKDLAVRLVGEAGGVGLLAAALVAVLCFWRSWGRNGSVLG